MGLGDLGDFVRRWPGRHRSPLALALVLAVAGTVSSAAMTQTSNPTGDGAGSASVARPSTSSSPSAAQKGLPASVTRVSPLKPDAPAAVAKPAVHVASTVRTGAVDPGVTRVLLNAYDSAVAGSPPSCHLQVSLLAAIGQVESGNLVGRRLDSKGRTSVFGPLLDGKGGFAAIPDTDHGRLDGNARWDRALGAMQLLPSTVRAFGVDGDGDGVVDPQDVYDATATAAAYLCYGGRNLADPAVLSSAILAYNHSTAYRDLVLTYQRRYAGLGLDGAMSNVGLVASLPSMAALPLQPAPTHRVRPAHGGGTLARSRHGHAGAGNVVEAGGPVAHHGGTPSGHGRPSPSGSPTSATPSGTTPSATGSPTPTRVPTDTPTDTPTGTPTDTPSDTPTGTPTETPTDTPTGTPTCAVPTATPPASPTPSADPTCSSCGATPTDTATPTAAPTATDPAGDPVCPSSDGAAEASPTPTP